jgi:hypothetical protein
MVRQLHSCWRDFGKDAAVLGRIAIGILLVVHKHNLSVDERILEMNRAVTLPRRALRRHDAEGAHRRTDSSRQACKPEVLAEPLPVQESVSDATIAAPELPPYLRMRRSFDQLVALLLLIVCSPLLLALILLVRLTSKGRSI